MNLADLNKVALAMVTPGKGILAADESSGTIKKRFDAIDVESTEESRRFYRGLLFTAPGMEDSIGGVINIVTDEGGGPIHGSVLGEGGRKGV